jgi:hypothetical protein
MMVSRAEIREAKTKSIKSKKLKEEERKKGKKHIYIGKGQSPN